MTPNEQRIAISEACGWEYIPEHDVEFNTPAGKVMPACWRYESADGNEIEVACSDGLPDYLNDLNAVHAAEKTLSIQLPAIPHKDSERTRYVNMLIEMCGTKGMCMASAAQRAEAFLRTIGKWKE